MKHQLYSMCAVKIDVSPVLVANSVSPVLVTNCHLPTSLHTLDAVADVSSSTLGSDEQTLAFFWGESPCYLEIYAFFPHFLVLFLLLLILLFPSVNFIEERILALIQNR